MFDFGVVSCMRVFGMCVTCVFFVFVLRLGVFLLSWNYWGFRE